MRGLVACLAVGVVTFSMISCAGWDSVYLTLTNEELIMAQSAPRPGERILKNVKNVSLGALRDNEVAYWGIKCPSPGCHYECKGDEYDNELLGRILKSAMEEFPNEIVQLRDVVFYCERGMGNKQHVSRWLKYTVVALPKTP